MQEYPVKEKQTFNSEKYSDIGSGVWNKYSPNISNKDLGHTRIPIS